MEELNPNPGNGANQRRSERFNVSWPSRVLLPCGRIIAARTKDVSVGGVGFELDEAVDVGKEISIELSPCIAGKKHVVRSKCVITYSMILAAGAGFSHGVKFTSMPDEYRKVLKLIIKSLA